MTAVSASPPLTLRVDPALAEAAVLAMLSGSTPIDDRLRARHHRRTARAYGLDDPGARDREFAAVARAEFHELGLVDPLLVALGERPALAARTRVLLVGQARAGHDEGVTCEPGAQHLGFRLEPRRFGDPPALARWARHALGHAEDTLDPAFGFIPGWDGDGRGVGIRTAAQERVHRFWDVSVDGRLARQGFDGGSGRARHVDRLRADLPGASPEAVEAAMDRLWSGARPTFATLLGWAERPAGMVEGLDAAAIAPPRPDRCPLCRFPSDDVGVPEPEIAARVVAEYHGWRPEQGLCGRCTDRYGLAGRLGGAA